EDGIRDGHVTGVQTCALPISIEAEQIVMRDLDCPPGAFEFLISDAVRQHNRLRVLYLDQQVSCAGARFQKCHDVDSAEQPGCVRSEERRVGKECRCRWGGAST